MEGMRVAALAEARCLGRMTPRRVACRADSRPDRPVFEMAPPRGLVTLADARDAWECCRGLTGVARTACYSQFGADADKVERYLWAVEDLEEQLHRGEEMVFKLGPLKICVDVDFLRHMHRVTGRNEGAAASLGGAGEAAH